MKQLKIYWPFSYINGIKGAISLFLAVLMTPFLTIGMLLVEAGRYNSAVSLLDEAMGVSSYSVLADYDPYLLERWGLLGVSQNVKMEEKFADYMDVNVSSIGNSFEISKCTVDGMYPLSNKDILYNQIMEYSKLNAPTQIASRLLSVVGDAVGDIKSVQKFLDKITPTIQILDTMSSVITAGIKIIDSGITLVDSSIKMKESAQRLEELASKYEADYVSFATSVNSLIGYYQQKIDLENQLTQLNQTLTTLQEEQRALQETSDGSDTTKAAILENEEKLIETTDQINSVKQQLNVVSSNISSAKSNSNSAQTTYAATLNDIKNELQNFRTLTNDTLKSMSSISNDILSGAESLASLEAQLHRQNTELEKKKNDLEKANGRLKEWAASEDDPEYLKVLSEKIALEEQVAELERTNAALETDVAIIKAGETCLGEMTSEMSTSFEDYSDEVIASVISGFDKLRTKVLALNIGGISASSPSINREQYRNIEVAGYVAADEIDAFLEAQEKKLKEGQFSALMDGLLAIYNSVMGMSIFFEDDLSACLNVNYYDENVGGLPGGTNTKGDVIDLLSSLGSAINSVETLKMHMQTLQLWKLLRDLKDVAQSILNLIISLGNFIRVVIENIAEAATGYDRWYLTTYCTYNLSCRSDFSNQRMSFTNMSGKSFGDESFPNKGKGTFNVPVFGEISALINTIKNCMNQSGSDITFNGAELEYVLFGSSSEVANQLYVFCVLYVLRVLECIPMITANAEIQGLAAASTFGYPVVMGLYYVLEPLVEVVLLCNGKNQPLVPTKPYLTPSGLPKLLTSLVFFCKLTSEQEEKIKGKMISAFTTAEGEYDYQKKLFEYTGTDAYGGKSPFDFSYKDFCMVLLLLTVSKDRMLERLSNVIQMETLYHYQYEKASYTFDLKKSCTFIHAETEAKVGQIMPGLLDASIFTVKREQYRGY
ncbi:MAG: hypothetical protein ACI3W5_16210 [Faecousia sp.]